VTPPLSLGLIKTKLLGLLMREAILIALGWRIGLSIIRV